MPVFRTDLTLETALQIGVAGKKARRAPGVRVQERVLEGYAVTAIAITEPEGSRALQRPMGNYITIDLQPYFQRQNHCFSRGVHCISRELRQLLPPLAPQDCVLVVGIGNRSLACDAVGPTAVEHLLVTRHMSDPACASFQPVAAIASGVAGQTGMEALELIAGTAQRIHPAAIIVIDALCAHSRSRLCTTVQLSDTGLTPGSGVGNHRTPIDLETLGVPVLAVGIPTVIAGTTLAQELTGEPTQTDDAGLFVTPRDVDSRVRELGRLLGYGLSAALQPRLTVEDITGLLG